MLSKGAMSGSLYGPLMPSWDALYEDPSLLPVPEEPEPFVVRALEALPAPRSARVLDVGCGGGRHLVWLERQGFSAHGVDDATHGVVYARAWLRREGHTVRIALADMAALPFAGDRFDAVIGHDVIYHAVRDGVLRALTEVGRVLRDEGTFVGTLLSTRAWKYGEGRCLERSTYVQERGAEAGVVHHYCDEAEARALLAGFDVDSLALDEYADDDGHRHSHWRFVAIKRGR